MFGKWIDGCFEMVGPRAEATSLEMCLSLSVFPFVAIGGAATVTGRVDRAMPVSATFPLVPWEVHPESR